MRLAIEIPSALQSAWVRESDTRIVARSGARAATITVGELIALPDDVPAWVGATLTADIPRDAVVERGGLVEHQTGTGWRFRLADARVLVDGQPCEIRMGAFYRFFEYTAAALVVIPGPGPAPDLARQAIEILATAAPDWSSRIVAMHQLWAGVAHNTSG